MKYFGVRALREDATYVFTEYLWTKKCIISGIVAALIFIIITIVVVVLLPDGTDKVPPSSSSNNSSTDAEFGDVPIVRRSEWGAMAATEKRKLQKLPAEYVIVAHTKWTFCRSRDQCIKAVREIQESHMWANGWWDIGYNFLVGGDGRVYEGCEWDIEGSHSLEWNKKSIGIAFMGDYEYDEPTRGQVDAVAKLLSLGVEQSRLTENYKVLAHKQAVNTLSPGEKLYNVIKTWKHWSECPNVSEPEHCST